MERLTRFRSNLLILLFCVVLVFFGLKLYDMQVIATNGNTDNRSTFTTYTRVKASRGDMLDTKGNILVGNRASYDLVINHYVLASANGTNDHLYRLVMLCKELGIQYNDHLPISMERPFSYTLSEYSSAWQSYFQKFLNHVGGLDSDITATLLMEKLRDYYGIPNSWNDYEARLVIGVWYEMSLRNCVSSLPNYVFLSDADDASLSAIIELNVPGMTPEATTVREYNTKYAAHILGYVGAMSPAQWEYFKNIDGYAMDAHVGQDGLEEVYEEYLHGVDGLREDVVTTDGTLISSRYIVEPKAGANVEISIDINLQMAAEDTLAKIIEDLKAQEKGKDGQDAGGGAVTAINVKTGQVLVCGSYPTFNLDTFFEDYEANSTNPLAPLYNRALLATYPPGSTYKMNMVISAIDSGHLSSTEKIYSSGLYKKYNLNVSCHYWGNYHLIHGNINAATALERSCNYFFYELGDRVPIAVSDATAKALGLGEKTGVELFEVTGYRANPETKKLLHKGDNASWYMGDQILAAIGQSENQFTPIQLCNYAATLANRGKRYKATFLNRVVSADYTQLLEESMPKIVSTLDISDDAFKAYTEGMYLASSTEWGTAASTFYRYPIKVASKTGTAEIGITGASDNASFICYAPLDDPEIAVSVYVERGGHGSTLAAVAKAIFDIYFEVGEVGDVNSFENQIS